MQREFTSPRLFVQLEYVAAGARLEGSGGPTSQKSRVLTRVARYKSLGRHQFCHRYHPAWHCGGCLGPIFPEVPEWHAKRYAPEGRAGGGGSKWVQLQQALFVAW